MGKSLGEFEQMVLIAVIALGDDAYGASVRREIEERTGREVSAGAVYTVLDRLERSGLVRSWVGEPTAERGGRRRKHYAVRPHGAKQLQVALERMRRMAAGMGGWIDRLAQEAE